jgi:hypothetical protein
MTIKGILSLPLQQYVVMTPKRIIIAMNRQVAIIATTMMTTNVVMARIARHTLGITKQQSKRQFRLTITPLYFYMQYFMSQR